MYEHLQNKCCCGCSGVKGGPQFCSHSNIIEANVHTSNEILTFCVSKTPRRGVTPFTSLLFRQNPYSQSLFGEYIHIYIFFLHLYQLAASQLHHIPSKNVIITVYFQTFHVAILKIIKKHCFFLYFLTLGPPRTPRGPPGYLPKIKKNMKKYMIPFYELPTCSQLLKSSFHCRRVKKIDGALGALGGPLGLPGGTPKSKMSVLAYT